MITTEQPLEQTIERPRLQPRRLLASIEGAAPGPTLICIGSLHGNEPAGYWALERVVATLEAARRDHGFQLERGALVALAGNLAALSEGRRFLDHDLNRGWSPDRIEELHHRPPATAEEREVRELVECIENARSKARGEVMFLDLHTTSGDSPPFISVADRLAYRRFALHFQAPVILGMEDCLDGTLLEWIDRLGFFGAVFEGGQHEAATSIDHNEAAVWIALYHLGLLGDASVLRDPMLGEPVKRSQRVLAKASEGLPKMLEIRYRHELNGQNSFRMAPGFRSFQTIKAGTLLAYDGKKEVRSEQSGRLLMPLYQPQGDDGFFVMRKYGAWHRLASWFSRRSGLSKLLPLLPGVSRVSDASGDTAASDENDSGDEAAAKLTVDQRWRSGLRQGILRHFGYHAVARNGERWLLRRRI